MRNTLLAAALLLAGFSAQGQITLEHRYPAAIISQNFVTTKFSNGEIKYVVLGTGTSPMMTVYNENHSLLKQLQLPVVPNGYFQGLYFVSDKLFNQDAAIEYLCGYGITVGSQTRYRLLVMSETGSQLLVADTVTYYNVARVISGTTGLKLTIGTDRLDAGGNLTGGYTKVYALGGTSIPTAVKAESSASASAALPYPNPAEAKITLPYEVARGQQATLQVLDMVGRTVRQYTVDAAFKNMQLSVEDLSAGTYTYRVVSASGSVTRGAKFIIK